VAPARSGNVVVWPPTSAAPTLSNASPVPPVAFATLNATLGAHAPAYGV